MELMFPCIEGWDAQNNHEGYALDFGWLGSYKTATGIANGNTDILACADGIVEFEGYYKQTVNGKVYRPIGVIIRHDQFSTEYDYVSIYWHLKSTVIDVNDKVVAGQKIGVKGNTGISQGVHLHFTVLKVKKGEAIPDNHTVVGESNWIKDSIELKDMIRIYPRQWFKTVGNFKLTYKTFDRDTTKNQVLVDVVGMNKRMSPSVSGIKILGEVPKGYYNVYSTTEAEGYTWYEIDSETYIAGVEGITYLPIEVDDKDKTIAELKAKVVEQEQTIETLNAKLSQIKEIVG